MKVLFVSSGNSGPDPISRRQGDSLRNIGINVDFYELIGRGIFGYLSNVVKLRKQIKRVDPDILHAHYSFSGYVTTLTFSGVPLVVSLMGSDALGSGHLMKIVLKVFMLFWRSVIVKSEDMYFKLGNKKAHIIPNGVDFTFFYPIPRNEACEKLNWSIKKKHILFASNPNRPEKNFALAEVALKQLQFNEEDFELHYLFNIPMNEIVYYYNAADVLLLTSVYEGSPNVIKEAMACNCPIVATDVGDIKNNIQYTEGCFLTNFVVEDVAEKIRLAMQFEKRTNGREQITRLNSTNIAQRVLSLYHKVLKMHEIKAV